MEYLQFHRSQLCHNVVPRHNRRRESEKRTAEIQRKECFDDDEIEMAQSWVRYTQDAHGKCSEA